MIKRSNPFGSLLGFFLAIILFIGLGFLLWFDRGLAFSPGPVTEISKDGYTLQGFTSHAEFEKQCGFCHEPLKTSMTNKCVLCHEAENQQIILSQGVHSRIQSADQCSRCHSDHRGRNFDPTLAAYQLFDHSNTRFSLNWHHENYDATPIQCETCHKNGDYSSVDSKNCLDCHVTKNSNFSRAHTQDYGTDCLECHDGLDRMQNFDHQSVGYPLAGKHQKSKCSECHTSGNVSNTPVECSGCHIEPASHSGIFSQACEECHTPDNWSPAIINNQSFSHNSSTSFSLALHAFDYSNKPIDCKACHPENIQVLDILMCVKCHSQNNQNYMDEHQKQFGSDCLVCHDGMDRLSNFDHANFFPLNEIHSSIECESCHQDKFFRGTPTECWQCHLEPEIHAGVFGLSCFYCHGEGEWVPANLRQHRFPLNHGIEDQNLQLDCITCHGENYFEYSCFSCHDHKFEEIEQSHKVAGILEQELNSCVNCHPDGTLKDGNAYP